MTANRSDFERLIQEVDVLLADLGDALLGGRLSFSGEDPAQRRAFAATWLDERWSRICQTICGEDALRAVLTQHDSTQPFDENRLIQGLVDVGGEVLRRSSRSWSSAARDDIRCP